MQHLSNNRCRKRLQIVDSTVTVKRSRNYLEVTDADGCRHLLRIGCIQWLSDVDTCRNETLLTASGRTIHIPLELDVLRGLLETSPFPHRGYASADYMMTSQESSQEVGPEDTHDMTSDQLLDMLSNWLSAGHIDGNFKKMAASVLEELSERLSPSTSPRRYKGNPSDSRA
jgi:hypothetical protein